MSSFERNKVKSFGDSSVDHGEMADQFLVVGAIIAPLFQIGLKYKIRCPGQPTVSKNEVKKYSHFFVFWFESKEHSIGLMNFINFENSLVFLLISALSYRQYKSSLIFPHSIR